MCFVRNEDDGMWYRAECVEVAGDGKPAVLYIDYGNISVSTTSNLRKMPEEFAYRFVTFDCIIAGKVIGFLGFPHVIFVFFFFILH